MVDPAVEPLRVEVAPLVQYAVMNGGDPRKGIRRFLIGFPVCLLAGFALLQVPQVDAAIMVFTEGITWASAGLIHLLGGQAVVVGRILRNPVNGLAVEVQNGCNGVNVTVLLWAAILTYPAGWTRKVKGLLAGTAALHILNLIRVISLFYLRQYRPYWFVFAHLYAWESLIVLDTLVVFWIWASRGRRIAGHASTI